MVNSTIYGKVTYRQISDMKHAIGFNNKKVTGTKHRKYIPYRNYFNTGASDIESWDMLVSIGFAIKGSKNWYSVSDDGFFFLELVTGVKISNDSLIVKQ